MNTELTILEIMLAKLRVKHTHSFANKLFEEHPHKTNLYGLSEMLSTYGIENAGVRIEDKSQLSEIETPFIAHFGSDFVVVTRIEEGQVHYYWKGKPIKLPKDQFEQAWTGVALLVETNEQSIEPDYSAHRREELFDSFSRGVLLLSVVGLIGLGVFQSALWSSWSILMLFFLNLLGLVISYFVVLKQLHIKGTYADKVCSLFSKSDCNNVLESDAAMLMGTIHWSEIGLGYFVSSVLLMLLFPWSASYLVWISLCALPYSFWSVWYQRVRAKQWCPLCLMAMGVFWSLFIVSWLGDLFVVPSFEWASLCWIGVLFALPVTAIHLLVKPLSESRKLRQITYEINHLKANESLFLALLQQQSRYSVSLSDSGILFGNREAPVLISVLTNPHCEPCARMHTRIDQFLKQCGDKYCVQYLFSSFNPSLDESNKALIAAYQDNTKEKAVEIFNEWFASGKREKDTFFSKHNLQATPEVEVEFARHEAWKQQTQLRSTPTILINGYVLPENYKIEDLLMMELPFETR